MCIKNIDRCPGFVPEGLDEGSQAVHCLECIHKKCRTVGHGLSWSTDGFAIQVENVPSHPIIPFPTGRVRFLPSPGSKLPGYDHLVPSGQNAFPRPVHKIDSITRAWSDID